MAYDFLDERNFGLGINGLTMVDSDGVIQYNFPRKRGFPSQFIMLDADGQLKFEYLDSIEAATVADGSLTYAKFAQSIEPVGLENSLPNPVGYDGPSIIFLTTTEKLYRYVDGGWVSAIDSIDIPDFSISEQKIQVAAVGVTQIKDGSINTPKLATNAITSEKITALAITVDKIAANAVTAPKINANSVTADKIAANAVTAEKVATNAITSDKILANSITAGKIAAGAISATQLSSNEISAHYSSFGTLKVGSAQIDDLAVTNAKIANLTVGTSKIANRAVTQPVYSQSSGFHNFDMNIDYSSSPENIGPSITLNLTGEPVLFTFMFETAVAAVTFTGGRTGGGTATHDTGRGIQFQMDMYKSGTSGITRFIGASSVLYGSNRIAYTKIFYDDEGDTGTHTYTFRIIGGYGLNGGRWLLTRDPQVWALEVKK